MSREFPYFTKIFTSETSVKCILTIYKFLMNVSLCCICTACVITADKKLHDFLIKKKSFAQNSIRTRVLGAGKEVTEERGVRPILRTSPHRTLGLAGDAVTDRGRSREKPRPQINR